MTVNFLENYICDENYNKKQQKPKSERFHAVYILLLLCDCKTHLFNYSLVSSMLLLLRWRERERTYNKKIILSATECAKFFIRKQQRIFYSNSLNIISTKSVSGGRKLNMHIWASSKAQSSLFQKSFSSECMFGVRYRKCLHWRRRRRRSEYVDILRGVRVKNCASVHKISMRWVGSVKILSHCCHSSCVRKITLNSNHFR